MNTITYYKQNVWFEALKKLKQLVRVFWYLHCNAMQQGSAQVWGAGMCWRGWRGQKAGHQQPWVLCTAPLLWWVKEQLLKAVVKTESLELGVIFGFSFFKKAALEYSGVWWGVCNPVPEQVKISSFSKLEISPLNKWRYRHGHRFYMYI